jgi:hypothetical protein
MPTVYEKLSALLKKLFQLDQEVKERLARIAGI